MTFEEMVKKLTLNDLYLVETHYYAAVENSHGSGDHWILMALLDRYGFRTNSPTKAVDVAEEIITTWYRLQE